MADLSAVGAFLLNFFVSLWEFLLTGAGWVGIAILGFAVVRILIFALSFLLSRRDDNK